MPGRLAQHTPLAHYATHHGYGRKPAPTFFSGWKVGSFGLRWKVMAAQCVVLDALHSNLIFSPHQFKLGVPTFLLLWIASIEPWESRMFYPFVNQWWSGGERIWSFIASVGEIRIDIESKHNKKNSEVPLKIVLCLLIFRHWTFQQLHACH